MATGVYISNSVDATPVCINNTATKDVVLVGAIQGAVPVRLVGPSAAELFVRVVGGPLLVAGEELEPYEGEEAFSPLAIPDILVWLTAGAITLSDGQNVSTWGDSTSSAYDASQGTAANQPVFKTGILADRPVVRFDGINDRLVTPSILHGIDVGDVFTAVVARTANPLGGARATCAMGNYAPAYYVSGTHPDFYIVGDHNFATTLSPGTWYTIITRRVSGVVDCTVNGAIDSTTFVNADSVFDGPLTVGDEAPAGGSPWSGDIAEVLFGKMLSDANRALLEAYLRSRYGHY